MRARAIPLVLVVSIISTGGAPVAHGIVPTTRAAVLAALPDGTPPRTTEAVTQALDRRDDAEALAAEIDRTDGAAARLVIAARRAGIDVREAPAVPRHATVSAALADLAVAAGVPDAAALAEASRALDLIPAEVGAPIAQLAGAMAVATRLRAEAFAGLGPADLEYVRGIAGDLMTRPERLSEARLAALTERIDLGALVRGALAVAVALDVAGERLRAVSPLVAEAVAAGTPAPAMVPPVALDPGCPLTVPLLPPPVVAISPLIAIGLPIDECYTLPYLLSIDLGGNDVYTNTNNAGGTRALLSANWLPVAVALDVGGDDRYHSELAGTTPSPVEEAIEGGAELGIGLLADLAGNDTYHSNFSTTPACPTLAVSDVVTQGAALLGIGILLDDSLDFLTSPRAVNVYSSFDTLTSETCDASYQVLYSQGSALAGIGILAQDLHQTSGTLPAATTMNSWNHVKGRSSATYLVDHSQGAGSGVGIVPGVGVLAVVMDPLTDVAGGGHPLLSWHLDRLNSNNVVDQTTQRGGGGANYTVRCSQGVAGFCAYVPAAVSPPGGALGVGVLVNLEGWGHYNTLNQVWGLYRPVMLIEVVQGAAGAGGGLDTGIFVARSRPPFNGTHPDPGPVGPLVFRPCFGGIGIAGPSPLVTAFNTCNHVGGLFAAFTVRVAQGAAEGLGLPVPGPLRLPGRAGVMLRLTSDTVNDTLLDFFNSHNLVIDGEGGVSVVVDLVQGAAAGALTAGTFVSGRRSAFNSYNAQDTSGIPLMIRRVQGYGEGPLAAGVMLDLYPRPDLGPPGSVFNVDNSAPTGPAPVLSTDSALGVAAGLLAVGAFVSVGGANDYNSNGILATPDYLLTATYAQAGTGLALFVDLTTQFNVDTYRPPDAPVVACNGALAVFVDALDGLADGPPLPGATQCVDDPVGG